MRYFGHTLPDQPEASWQPLQDHLDAVAAMAAEFASAFDADEWGHTLGAWHDLGKYSEAFQNYLRRSAAPDPHRADLGHEDGTGGRVDHSTAGAQHAVETLPVLGHLLACAIAGHHAGLLDSQAKGACLSARLRKPVPPWRDGAALPEPPSLHPPPALAAALAARDGFRVSFFVRMLFSCLVDADFLDTESFVRPDRGSLRPAWPPDVLARMAAALDSFVAAFGAPDTSVDRQRCIVREACLEAAESPPGLFSLTVPTGGGKTLSSLAFALRHARLHRLRRIVYVIPFTSIIEQNADVFRKVMAPILEAGLPDPVLEHHSNLDEGKATYSNRLAAENWDAPLVVTTSVQFYESLFAARTSRCRKLHRLARSVIILDESQTLPVDFLEPCLRALHELSTSYGATIVSCTATQPAVHARPDFPIGLPEVREIVPDAPALYEALRRVQVSDLGRLDDGEIAARLQEHEQVLCIVNTRGHARELFERLDDVDGTIHLSALMCPEHRTEVLARIRRRLEEDRSCRVVSTQLIEAGVDIDFPVVYRSLAGLDSIAQAAGRCNREGKSAALGHTYVFRSTHTRAEAWLADTAQCAAQVLPLHADPLSLTAIEHYSRLYYWDQSDRWDAKDICGRFQLVQEPELPFLFAFRTAADDFELIEDTGQPVIVPWGDRGRALCRRLESDDAPDRGLRRALQRYTISVPERLWARNLGSAIVLRHEHYPVLANPELYSETTGLELPADGLTTLIA